MESVSCPWQQFPQQIDLHPFCEERLCSWIAEPANTWSNIGYLIVAILIFRADYVTSATKDTSFNKEAQRVFWRATFFLFLGSTFFHMSGTVMGKMADVSAMFLLSVGIFCLSLKRLGSLKDKTTEIIYFSLLGFSLLFLFVFKFGNIVFASQLIFSCLIEIYLVYKGRSALSGKNLLGAVAVAATAFLFWNLDVTGIYCDPHNHIINGHGLWHLLTALAIFLLYKAYPSGRGL